MQSRSIFARRITYPLAAALLALALLLAYLWFAPLNTDAQQPAPFDDYANAAGAVQRLADDDGAVNPLCRTRLLGHGAKTAQAVVIFHGISNCPQQFAAIAEKLHAAGYNVLLARLPRQGLADRLDESVRTEMYRAVAAGWQAHGADVFLYEFPIAAGLKYDMIDPAQPDQQAASCTRI